MPLVKPDLEFVFGLQAKLGEMVVVGETPEGSAPNDPDRRRHVLGADAARHGRSAAARIGSSCAATA